MRIQCHYNSRWPFWVSSHPGNPARREIVDFLRSTAYRENHDYRIPKTGEFIRMIEPVFIDWEQQFFPNRCSQDNNFRQRKQQDQWLYENFADQDFAIGCYRMNPVTYSLISTYYFRNPGDLVQFKLTWSYT